MTNYPEQEVRGEVEEDKSGPGTNYPVKSGPDRNGAGINYLETNYLGLGTSGPRKGGPVMFR